MNAEQRNAAFAETKAQSIDALARTASVKVVHRDHDADVWQRPEPEPVRRVSPGMTDAEVANMIAAAVAEQVDAKVATALAAHDEFWHDVIGRVVAAERHRHRGELEKLDLRLSALLSDVTKRQAVDTVERNGIVDLPALPLRGVRRA